MGLGIEEALGNLKAATAAYQQSGALRPHPGIQERLRTLQANPLELEALPGPRATLAEVCATAFAEKPDCKLASVKAGRLASAAQPHLEVEVGSTSSDDSHTAHLLLIRTKRGWYWHRLADVEWLSGRYGAREELTLKELALRDLVPGGASELLLRFQLDSMTGTDEGTSTDYLSYLMVCSLGPSEAPSCNAKLLLEKQTGLMYKGRLRSSTLKSEFLPTGELSITPESKVLEDEQRALVGKHRLVFP